MTGHGGYGNGRVPRGHRPGPGAYGHGPGPGGHGLGLQLGVVFILGAPVTLTALGLLETRRLRRHHGVRLRGHPLTHGAR
ncbi:hypothetical protein [Streptomyces reniochalinae]|uniref:Uncharacterized protein n=1 Tax=Streptomyces reniochalinae TaxID=2250578 RepID=A0A367F2P7_9ACTN|nr:hypothetical protein [Streptomyces reniochalinae]RCG24593.1 hypothetical protein DQ392_02430 [Streptomyces reniochalinae]